MFKVTAVAAAFTNLGRIARSARLLISRAKLAAPIGFPLELRAVARKESGTADLRRSPDKDRPRTRRLSPIDVSSRRIDKVRKDHGIKSSKILRLLLLFFFFFFQFFCDLLFKFFFI